MTAEEQDKYLLDVLNALEESNKSGTIEIPQEALESDDAMIEWLKSL